MKPYNKPNIISAGTVMNTNITSPAQQVYNAFSFGIQITFTGTPTGSFKLQASCDQATDALSSGNYSGNNLPTHWTDIANSTFAVSAAGNVEWDYDMPGFNWVRVVYADSSGGSSTAVISSATLNVKGF